MALLTTADYPEIRAAIDISVDAAALPDATIALSLYHAAGEQAVLDRDPLAATRTGTDAERVRRAAICIVAARLCKVIPAIKSEEQGEYGYNREPFKPKERAEELEVLAAHELQAVLQPSVSPARPRLPTLFVAGRGGRGR